MSEKLLSETVNRYNTYEMNEELDSFTPNSPRRGDMFIAQGTESPPARFGVAELSLTSTNLVSFRHSEPRLGLLGIDL